MTTVLGGGITVQARTEANPRLARPQCRFGASGTGDRGAYMASDLGV